MSQVMKISKLRYKSEETRKRSVLSRPVRTVAIVRIKGLTTLNQSMRKMRIQMKIRRVRLKEKKINQLVREEKVHAYKLKKNQELFSLSRKKSVSWNQEKEVEATENREKVKVRRKNAPNMYVHRQVLLLILIGMECLALISNRNGRSFIRRIS